MINAIKNFFVKKIQYFNSSFFKIEKKEETLKFVYIFVIIFLIAYNYNALRPLKDTVMITAHNSGAEVIPFIKFWLVLPLAILMSIIFTKLSHRYGSEKVFYLMISIFLIFFTIFIFILYPLKDLLHPHNFADYLETVLPSGFKGFIAIIRNWTFALFYVMAELWGAIILNVLFWGVVNNVSTIVQAKKFYIILGIGANISGILSGPLLIKLSKNNFNPSIPFGKTAWDQSLLFILMILILVGILTMFLYKHFNTKFKFYKNDIIYKKDETIKPSFKKNISHLLNSKYLICIALIVIGYNLTINLTEILWKNQIKLLYPNPNDFNAYMGYINTITSIVATLIALAATSFLKKFSWTANALVTPIVLAITGLLFFSFFLLKNNSYILIITNLLGATPLFLCVFFGSMQNCISRSLKYSLFDATKEIAFIPLPTASKLKGKAAIDGVMSRFGKSISSITYQVLLICFSTLSATAPIIAILFVFIIIAWVYSVKALGRQFNYLEQEEKDLILQTNAINPTGTVPLKN